ncbi:hypothetical protein [Bradyrhizobium sp. STM 3566]|uniref:hypothetical protein n=1 Tax=Bradyrhizobium sp. STM 3566 TaxID=578928 RepID=UPI00388FBEDF
MAKFVQVLEYVDGPQAVLLERSADSKIVGVAIDREGFQSPFFGAEISRDQWERYRRGFVDFRFLFTHPRWKNWFYFDLADADKDGSITLLHAVKDELVEKHYLPEAGFFARDHSEPIQANDAAHLETHSYRIDGSWDLGDFSQFYGKITDIYSFFLALKKYDAPDTSPDLKKRVRQAFAGHPLRGGSSYVNLYEDLWSVQGIMDRISVRRIQYASPGNVDVNGRADIFDEMHISLAEFAKNFENLKMGYGNLYRFLAANQLLKADAERFDKSGPLADRINSLAGALAAALKLPDIETIYRLTDRNALSFAKIVLSYFRRLERYYLFFAEGRVQEG